jgi:hypothetical protein
MNDRANQKIRFDVRLRERDFARLDLIATTHNVTRAAAFRIALIALCRQLGYEKELPSDMLKIK